MRTRLSVGLVLSVLLTGLVWSTSASVGRGDGPVIYVTGQGLFYDSIVQADLPRKGRFQQLQMGGPSPSGLQTEFGPGAAGYLGGRWWLDLNSNGEMDDEDKYFSCPLLGPGREEA